MPEDLKLIMTPEEVAEVVSRLAEEISSDYRESTPVFVGVLKGASVFLSDLVRALKTPHEVDFIQTSAYGMREAPGEVVKVTREITADITGRDVIIVEGIVDRGLTAGTVKKHLAAKGPATLKVCTLLMREGGAGGGGGAGAAGADYVGRLVGPGFVVGYGMDYKERYRGLPGVYVMG